MILIFDLDDTLYEELTFVQSGFKVVSKYLSENYNLNSDGVFESLLQELKNGRGKIFDSVLEFYGIKSRQLVEKCISEYRSHKPDISLYHDSLNCLKRFKNLPLYVVTDGNKNVQYNKIMALDLQKYIKQFYITRRFGIKNEKPSPFCFEKICKLEKTEPVKVFCIGDNPNKDFVGIKPLGFKTVRIMRGNYRNVKRDSDFEADCQIENLDQLTEELLISL
jgi:putative hydrolase of the HAD superfamily